MNESRLINRLKNLEGNSLDQAVFYIDDVKALYGLLVKEKEKNKELETDNLDLKEKNRLIVENLNRSFISKDKIKEKIDLFRNRFNAENGVKTINYHLYSILIEEFSSLLEDEIWK